MKIVCVLILCVLAVAADESSLDDVARDLSAVSNSNDEDLLEERLLEILKADERDFDDDDENDDESDIAERVNKMFDAVDEAGDNDDDEDDEEEGEQVAERTEQQMEMTDNAERKLSLVSRLVRPKKLNEKSKCRCTQWTGWLDRDDPSATGDWETLDSFRIRGNNICDGMRPLMAECRVKRSSTVFTRYTKASTIPNKLLYQCLPEKGLACINKNQPKGARCKDYEIRFRCPACDCTTWETRWRDRDNPSATGDWEVISSAATPVCSHSTPVQARCLLNQDFTTPKINIFEYWHLGGLPDKLRHACDPHKGLACVNADQSPSHQCADYSIKYRCFDMSKTFWTPWLDRDNPGGSGDWETRVTEIQRGRNICNNMTPLAARCRVRVGRAYKYFDQYTAGTVAPDTLTYPCLPEHGLACINRKQKDKRCNDYHIRYLCPCQ